MNKSNRLYNTSNKVQNATHTNVKNNKSYQLNHIISNGIYKEHKNQ